MHGLGEQAGGQGRDESHTLDEDADGLAPVSCSSLPASLSPAAFMVCSSSLLHGLKSPLQAGTILIPCCNCWIYRVLALGAAMMLSQRPSANSAADQEGGVADSKKHIKNALSQVLTLLRSFGSPGHRLRGPQWTPCSSRCASPAWCRQTVECPPLPLTASSASCSPSTPP